mmetsp:Transcript_7075/g.10141  ORF Transcript_7075/g.10141 Transcript_7075/m.10141 type:complete len:435 (+) Transcript_7075:44-1348(+)
MGKILETISSALSSSTLFNLSPDTNKDHSTTKEYGRSCVQSQSPELLPVSMKGDLETMQKLVGEYIATHCTSSIQQQETNTTDLYIDPRLRSFINATDPQGNAAIHGATFSGYLNVTTFLVSTCGADALQPNKLGCTPMWLAAGYGHSDVLQYLLSSLFFAHQDLDEQAFMEALSFRNSTGDTPLIAAASKGHYETCRILLDAAHRLNSRDFTIEDEGFIRQKKLLGHVNQSGDTPLSVAIGASHSGEILDLLLDRWNGINNEPEKSSSSSSTKEIIQKIEVSSQSKTAPISLTNSKGLSPLLIACERNDAISVRKLLSRNALPLLGDGRIQSPLAVASFCGCEDVVKELLGTAFGMHLLNVQDIDGHVPLWLAARTGNVRMVKILVDAGAQLDHNADSSGNGKDDTLTPEGVARKYNKKKVVEFFEDLRQREQ